MLGGLIVKHVRRSIAARVNRRMRPESARQKGRRSSIPALFSNAFQGQNLDRFMF